METITVKKEKHTSNEWYALFVGKTIKRTYVFTEDSKYIINNVDQFDWNKLFGFTSGILPVVKLLSNNDERIKYCDFKIKLGSRFLCLFLAYHWNSARYGWRYLPDTNLFEVDSYVYNKGYRKFKGVLASYQVNDTVDFSIEKTKSSYKYKVKARHRLKTYIREVEVVITKFYGITLPLYFGGNIAAPKDVKITKY